MISLIALATVLSTQTAESIQVIEQPMPGSDLVAFQAFVQAEVSGQKDLSAWEMVGPAVLEGCLDYSSTEVSSVATRAGYWPEIAVLPGMIRIQMVCRPADAPDVANMLTQSLLVPKLREDGLLKSKAQVLAKRSRPFDLALRTLELPLEDVKPDDIRMIHQLAFRPKNIKIYISGNMEVGVLPNVIKRAERDWKDPGRPGRRPLQLDPRPPVHSGSAVASVELRAEPITASSRFAAARLLATTALGVGKDCTMFRVLREQLGLSYVQEAVLWPTTEGWIPRFVMLRDGGSVEDIAKMRTAMLEDIEKWDENVLKRALVLARASLTDGLPWSPVWLDSYGPMADTSADKLALFGYLDLVGQGGLSPNRWAATLENVELDTVKMQAKEMLEMAAGVYLPPKQ